MSHHVRSIGVANPLDTQTYPGRFDKRQAGTVNRSRNVSRLNRRIVSANNPKLRTSPGPIIRATSRNRDRRPRRDLWPARGSVFVASGRSPESTKTKPTVRSTQLRVAGSQRCHVTAPTPQRNSNRPPPNPSQTHFKKERLFMTNIHKQRKRQENAMPRIKRGDRKKINCNEASVWIQVTSAPIRHAEHCRTVEPPNLSLDAQQATQRIPGINAKSRFPEHRESNRDPRQMSDTQRKKIRRAISPISVSMPLSPARSLATK